MPLSELYRPVKGKVASSEEKNPSCSTDLSFVTENDLVELVWENGQILMQGQSSRVNKFPTSSGLSSHSPKTRDKDLRNGTNTMSGKSGPANSALNEIPISVPSGIMGLSEDDDMVPWLNYPINQSLQNENYSDFLPEISGVTLNEPSSTHNNFASSDRRSGGNPSIRDSGSVSVHNVASFKLGNVPKVYEPEDGEATGVTGGTSQLYPLSSPYVKSRGGNRIIDGMSNTSNGHAVSGDSIGVRTSAGGFQGTKMQKQDPSPPSNSSRLMNFSHFLRPAVVKACLQNIGATANDERIKGNYQGSAASSSNPSESTLIDSNSRLWKEKVSLCKPAIMPSKVDVKVSETKPEDKLLGAEPPPAMCQDDILMNDKSPCRVIREGATRGLQDGEKTGQPVVASSSVCSGNSGERASDDPPHNLKRKQCDNEEFACPSEDAEEESIGVKKAALTQPGTGSKRSRAAEVHNLSERRRRDRINEKMRALQELIPNCNKVDKASMLDEAIEYLKTLQIQVQIMSMGAGLYMPSMLLPTGMQHMHAAHVAHYSPMSVGMAMGYGIGLPDMNRGSSACPMVQVPPMHGVPFPGQQMSGLSALQGMVGSNLQSFVLPGQGLPMLMPAAPTPLIPMSGGPLLKSTMGLSSSGMIGPLHNMDSSMASTPKEPRQNINSQAIQITGASSSMNQTLGQCLATNESFEQPVTVHDNRQSSEVTESIPVRSTDGNEKIHT